MVLTEQKEPKKSFAGIYIGIAIFYITMSVIYCIIIHKATEEGAQLVPPGVL